MVWPFLLDVIVEAQNNALISAAGLPDKIPADWDEYLAAAKTVMDKGAAKYGCTFDSNGWRSLAPITHSISTKTYYNLEGDKTGFPLYDFTSDPAIQALMIMKQMLDLSSANALQPGSTDGGVNQTPDEIAFAAELVPYYIKYQNAPLRFAEKWKDPTQFRMGALPKAKGGEGGTVFWDTGACAVQVRQEQGEGRRVPEGAHLRAADLEGLDRGQRVRPSGAVAALSVDLRGLGESARRTG